MLFDGFQLANELALHPPRNPREVKKSRGKKEIIIAGSKRLCFSSLLRTWTLASLGGPLRTEVVSSEWSSSE